MVLIKQNTFALLSLLLLVIGLILLGLCKNGSQLTQNSHRENRRLATSFLFFALSDWSAYAYTCTFEFPGIARILFLVSPLLSTALAIFIYILAKYDENETAK